MPDARLAAARRTFDAARFDALHRDVFCLDSTSTAAQEIAMTATITAETITAAQIRTLRTEAERASDYLQVDICDVALASDEEGHEVGSGRTRTAMTRTEARAECARVIAAAAQE